MKVLLVTRQYVDIRSQECWCNLALYGTIQNMQILGELYVVASQLVDYKSPAQPINKKIEFLSADHAWHLLPINRSIGQRIGNIQHNRHVIREAIKGMDLVIGYAPSDAAAYAHKIAQKENIPFLTFLVGCPWDSLRHHHRWLARLTAPLTYLSTRRLVKYSDYVHYVTWEFLQHRYPTHGRSLGCSDVNLGQFDELAFARRIQHYKNKDRKKIKLITTANLNVRYKGQEYVIKAIAKLKAMYGDTRYEYYLVGGGDSCYLKALCRKLGVESQVYILGRKTTEEVFGILDDCDIYMQPSLTEGLPRAVVEAMSRAMPCIGFQAGGIPELLERQYVVKKKDVDGIITALRLLEDETEYLRVAKRNFAEAQAYDHRKLQEQIRNFFAEVKKNVEQRKRERNGLDGKN